MDAANVIAELYDRTGEARPEPRLHATRRAAELLGDPQRSSPVIHITGTNGKGSTARLVQNILLAHGLRVGMFTSPHLTSFNERIAIDGRPISDDDLVRNWEDVRPYITMMDNLLSKEGEPPLTFFEALTVLAFASFADSPVDVVVLEVGMGGEWDSTNIADADVAVFAPIAIDHASVLGDTLPEIARTKAGIIKAGSRVVSAEQSAPALKELERKASTVDAEIALEGRDFAVESEAVAVGGQVVSVRGRAARYPDLYLPLFGDHQGHNAALAIATCETFLGDGTVPMNQETLAEALEQAVSPGRLQLIAGPPTMLLDAAHNPHGAQALARALERYFDAEHIALVVGVMSDKDAEGILRELIPLATFVCATQTDTGRAMSSDDVFRRALVAGADPQNAEAFDNVDEALERARSWAAQEQGRMVVVAGSAYLVGEALLTVEDRGWA